MTNSTTDNPAISQAISARAPAIGLELMTITRAIEAFSRRADRTRSTISAYDQSVIDPSLLREIALDDGIAIILRELLIRGNVHADFVAETLRGAFVKRKA